MYSYGFSVLWDKLKLIAILKAVSSDATSDIRRDLKIICHFGI